MITASQIQLKVVIIFFKDLSSFKLFFFFFQ